MKKLTLQTGLLLVALLIPATAVQGQSALQIVRKLEALEARMGQLEGDVNAAATAAPGTDAADLDGSIADMREEMGRLSTEMAELRASADATAELRAQLDALSAELAAFKADAPVASEASAPTDSMETEVADVLAEVKAYMEAAAEREAATEESPLSFSGRVQAQYSTTSRPDEIQSDFMIRRARLEADLEINDIVSGHMQPDFGEGKITLKDAYVALDFDPAFNVTIGQFKRPFDLFELTSSTKILTVERAGVVRGAGSCAGPGGICTYSRFTEKLGFSDRDIGVRIGGEGGDWTWEAAVTNGTGANHEEENNAKSFGGRLVYEGISNLAIGANVAAHDYTNEIDPSRSFAGGYALDLEIGSFSGGWHAQAGVLSGDNWKNLDAAGAPSTFRAAQGVISYKRLLAVQGLDAIEPVARLSWGDPDTSFGSDDELFATVGVITHFVGRNKIAFNVERWMPTTGSGEWSVKVQSYLHF